MFNIILRVAALIVKAKEWENMDSKKIEELKQFVELCKANPSMIHFPSLEFFKDFLQSLGARIPSSGDSGDFEDEKKPRAKKPSTSRNDESDDDIVQSDVELDNSDVLEPENDPPQKMGDPSTEITEENYEAAQALKSIAMAAISEGKLNEAKDHLTEAITLNPKSAILYANRASVFVKLKKPNAAVRDSDAAFKINPDSAKAYKARGMAKAMLGLWEEAARDLHVASNLDYDEEIGTVLKKVQSNANKIGDHRRKYERLRKEKELRKIELERQRNQAKAQKQADAASVLQEGEVIGVQYASILKNKLDAASKASRLAIVYFTATWCGPCRYISPEYTRLSKKYPKVVFLKADVDEAVDAAAEWNISSIPTFFFVKNGRGIDQLVSTDKNVLEKKIIQHAG